MTDGFNIYSKNELNVKNLLDKVGINESDVLFMDRIEQWADKENQKMVIEYNGILDEECTDDYIGYHYYNVTLFAEQLKQRFENLNMKDVIIDME